jgi:hypothetical protein
MTTDSIRKYAGWAALIAGIGQTLGIVFLILMFAIEIPQGYDSPCLFLLLLLFHCLLLDC